MSEFGGALDAHLLKGSGDDQDSDEKCPKCGEWVNITVRRRRGGVEWEIECPECGYYDEDCEPYDN